MVSLGLKLLIPVVIGSGIKLYNDWKKKQELHKIRKDMVEAVNTAGDMDDVTEMLQVKVSTAKLKKRLRYNGMPAIIKAIQYAEMKVGLLKRTEANKMVVDKIIRDFMVKPKADGGLGMRTCDAVKNYIIAVSMYFMPRHQAVICNKLETLKTDEVEEAMSSFGLDGSY